jgi:hypothetical protein
MEGLDFSNIDKELLKIIVEDHINHSRSLPFVLNLGYTNKDAFVMRHIDGMCYKDICSIMDINLAKLKRGIRLFRGDLIRGNFDSLIKQWDRDIKLNILLND